MTPSSGRAWWGRLARAGARLKANADRPALGAALFGLLWLRWVGPGWRMLQVSDTHWLIVNDWGQAQLGWMFFRADPWRLPLGRFTSLIHPLGGTLGFSDSIPIAGLLSKLFSGLLPQEFQYVGWWLAACFMLQGYFGARISARFTRDPWARWLGGALVVTTPVLLARIMHPSLCAHWLLLAPIAAHLEASPSRRKLWQAALLSVLSAFVHPYLAVMVAVLSVALAVRVTLAEARRSYAALLSWVTGIPLALALAFWSLGYLPAPAPRDTSVWGWYVPDLNTFFNPMGYSRTLPELPHLAGAYEGLAFPGVGVLGLGVLGVALLYWRRPTRRELARVAPLGLSAALLLIPAFAALRWGGRTLFSWRPTLDVLVHAGLTFRSTGRFIWPLHYLIASFAVGMAALAFRDRPLLARGLLALGLVVQIGDTNFAPTRGPFTTSHFRPLQSAVWSLMRGEYRHLEVCPARIYHAGCGAPFDEDYVYPLDYLAGQLGLTINSGYLSRYAPAVTDVCRSAEQVMRSGRLDEHTAYLVPNARVFSPRRALCGRIDGYLVCVSRRRNTEFSRALARAR